MRFGRCLKDGVEQGICIIESQGFKRLEEILGIEIDDMNEVIENFEDIEKEVLKNIHNVPLYDMSGVSFLSPIPETKRNLICVGKNYLDHAKELEGKTANLSGLPKHPIFFSKMADKTIGDNETIKFDLNVTNAVDYEVELAVIVGKKIKNISDEAISDAIFGYTICNDITARDLQVKHTQWHLGKSLDTFTPLGPVIVTKDEFSFPPKIPINCTINDEIRQSSNTGQLIFSIETLLKTLSSGVTLIPGDIILTGTPAGVGMGFDPPRYLKNGDLIVSEIEGIGVLRNRVVTKN